jgi:hypothetical protein
MVIYRQDTTMKLVGIAELKSRLSEYLRAVRLVLGQPDVLREWRDVHQGVSSALITVEGLRTLDRLRIR